MTKMINSDLYQLSQENVNTWFEVVSGTSFEQESKLALSCLETEEPIESLGISGDQIEKFYEKLSLVVEPRGVSFEQLEDHYDELSTEELVKINLKNHPELDYLLNLARYVDHFGY